MGKLDPKPEIAIVRTIEQEQKRTKTHNQIFEELKKLSEEEAYKIVGNAGLNIKGRKYFVFPMLERLGINTWEQLDEESELIEKKESKLSSNARNAVIHLHTHCLIEKIQFDEKNT